jgi:hypothetical protein
MIGILRRGDRWLSAPAPAERLAGLRVVVGVYVLAFLVIRLPGLVLVTRLDPAQWDPVGPLSWLGEPLRPAVAQAFLAATVVLGVAFTAGWRWRITGPLFALAFLGVTTYRVSFGHVLHTDHLPALHVLLLAVVPAADAWSLDARRRFRSFGRPDRDPVDDARYGWPVKVAALMVVVAYVLAGVAKLRLGGWGWLSGDVLRNQVAFDNLRKSLLGDIHSPLGGWAVRYGWLFGPMAVATVAVELGAPVALRGGRWRTGWVAGAWLFHVGIVALMAIGFPYQLSGAAYASFVPLEEVPDRWRRSRLARRLSRRTGGSVGISSSAGSPVRSGFSAARDRSRTHPAQTPAP